MSTTTPLPLSARQALAEAVVKLSELYQVDPDGALLLGNVVHELVRRTRRPMTIDRVAVVYVDGTREVFVNDAGRFRLAGIFCAEARAVKGDC